MYHLKSILPWLRAYKIDIFCTVLLAIAFAGNVWIGFYSEASSCVIVWILILANRSARRDFLALLENANRSVELCGLAVKEADQLRERLSVYECPNGDKPTYEARVMQMIQQRRERGLSKYGAGLEAGAYSRAELLQMAKEELADLLIYLEAEKAATE